MPKGEVAELNGAQSYLDIAKRSLERAGTLLNHGTAHLAMRREAREKVEDAVTLIDGAMRATDEELGARRG